jgi:hypothetical protein
MSASDHRHQRIHLPKPPILTRYVWPMPEDLVDALADRLIGRLRSTINEVLASHILPPRDENENGCG